MRKDFPPVGLFRERLFFSFTYIMESLAHVDFQASIFGFPKLLIQCICRECELGIGHE